MARRNAKTESAVLDGEELLAEVERIAAKPAGTVTQITVATARLKAVTDRVRRLPRFKGWSALTVATVTKGDDVTTLAVTTAGVTATPWPKREQPAKAPAKKAPAKKATAKKAPAKRTAKAAA